MSFGRLLKRSFEGKESLEDVINRQLKLRPTYSFEAVKKAAKSLSDYTEEEDMDKDVFQKKFFSLWLAMFAEHDRSAKVIHPSSFRNDCLRQLYYQFTDAEESDVVTKKISGGLQRIFDMGTWIHVYIQVLLWQAGVLEEAEAVVRSRKKRIGGRTDGIIKWEGERMVLEIKSIGSRGYPTIITKPKDDHEYQASVYASELGISKICYLYFNKDTAEIKIHIRPTHAAHVKNANEKIEELNYSIAKKVAPTKICRDFKSEAAKTCPFKTLCLTKKK